MDERIYAVVLDDGGGSCVDVVARYETPEQAFAAAQEHRCSYVAKLTPAALEDLEKGLRPYRAAVLELNPITKRPVVEEQREEVARMRREGIWPFG